MVSGLREFCTPTISLLSSTPCNLLMIFLDSGEANSSASKLPDIGDGTPSHQVLDNYLAPVFGVL